MISKQTNLFYRSMDFVLRQLLWRLPVSRASENAALTWGYRFRAEPRVVQLRSGARMHFDGADFIPLNIYYLGVFEPYVIFWLGQMVEAGDTVIDVGANIGVHTLEAWTMVGNGGRVVSIEASPQHSATIRRNLALNGFHAGDVVNCAVGDSEGHIVLGLPEGGTSGMYGVNVGNASFTVSMQKLDDIVCERSLASISLIKMDIEGSELVALRGAEETIRQHHPAILIELNETALARCASSADAVVELLTSLGYDGWIITKSGLRTIRIGDRHECDECLFLHNYDKRREKLPL